MTMIRFLSNLRLLQNPKSAQCTAAARIRGRRNLSSDQCNGTSVELTLQSSSQDEFLACNRSIGSVGETNGTLENSQIVDIRIGEIARKVSGYIETQPGWEEHLLSEFPSVNFADQVVYVAVLRQQSNALSSFRFYTWLKSLTRPSLDVDLCNIVFRRLVHANCADVARRFLDEAKFEPKPKYLESYVRCLCRTGYIDEAAVVLEQLRRISYDVSLKTWNLALLHSVRKKRSDIVWRIYGCMTEGGIVMDGNTLGQLILAYCLDENVAKGFELLQQVLVAGHVPGRVVFNKLISALVWNRFYSRASIVLHNMIAKNCAPDNSTYQGIIHGLINARMVDEGFHIFNELKGRGYLPNRVMYTIMIHGLCKNNNLGDARNLWLEMSDKGSFPDEYTYNVFINGLFKSGSIDEAKQIYQEMLAKGFVEKIITCNIMINGFCHNGKVEEARQMFYKMNDKGIIPDSITYNSLLKGYLRQGNLTEGTHILLELLKQGFQPTITTFTMLIEELCKAGLVKEAETLWLDMRDPDSDPPVDSLNTIIRALSKQGCFSDVIKWVGFMISNGIRPRKRTLEEFVECLSAAKKDGDALLVLGGYMLKLDFCSLERLSAILR